MERPQTAGSPVSFQPFTGTISSRSSGSGRETGKSQKSSLPARRQVRPELQHLLEHHGRRLGQAHIPREGEREDLARSGNGVRGMEGGVDLFFEFIPPCLVFSIGNQRKTGGEVFLFGVAMAFAEHFVFDQRRRWPENIMSFARTGAALQVHPR